MLVTMTSPHQPHRVPGGAAPPQFPGQATPYPAGQQQAGDGDWGAATPAVPHVYGPGPVPSAYGQPAYPPAYPAPAYAGPGASQPVDAQATPAYPYPSPSPVPMQDLPAQGLPLAYAAPPTANGAAVAPAVPGGQTTSTSSRRTPGGRGASASSSASSSCLC